MADVETLVCRKYQRTSQELSCCKKAGEENILKQEGGVNSRSDTDQSGWIHSYNLSKHKTQRQEEEEFMCGLINI